MTHALVYAHSTQSYTVYMYTDKVTKHTNMCIHMYMCIVDVLAFNTHSVANAYTVHDIIIEVLKGCHPQRTELLKKS